jgi:peptide/nickel transport system substrate-binding protein
MIQRKFLVLTLLFSLLLSSVVNIGMTNAASNNLVVIHTSNPFTSLNPYTPDSNLTINRDVNYLTSTGFNYINGQGEVVPNTSFGRYDVIPPSGGISSYQVKYTWNSEAVWSDGVPITKEDFLLWYMVTNNSFARAAGLGSPDNGGVSAFRSVLYSSWENTYIDKPSGWGDNFITFQYSNLPSDWEMHTPIAMPAHALSMLAEGGTISSQFTTHLVNANLAKSNFFKAFSSNETGVLRKLGDTWSKSYNISRVDRNTNPLLLVCNGAYRVSEAGVDPIKNVRLVKNDRSISTEPRIASIEFALYSDGNRAEAAVDSGEIDIYAMQATADTVARFKTKTGINVVSSDASLMEHFDIRVGGTGTTWNSAKPLQGQSVQARELRSALLMAIPRQEIIDSVIKPVNSRAEVPESLIVLPSNSNYFSHVQNSDVSKFSPNGESASFKAEKALQIVKKYYPTATAERPVIPVRILYGANNSRRAAVGKLINANLSKAGFQVTEAVESSWASKLTDPTYDAMYFAWVISPWSSAVNIANPYCSACPNNYIGLSNVVIDNATKAIASSQTTSEKEANYAKIENQVVSIEAASLPLFVHPVAVAVSKDLNNFKPSSNTPVSYLWNFWEWSVGAVNQATISCTRGNTTRLFASTRCPVGWEDLSKPDPTPTPTPTPTKAPVPVRPSAPLIELKENNLLIQMKLAPNSTSVFLYAPELGIPESNPLQGVVRDGIGYFTTAITSKFSGLSVNVSSFSVVGGVNSDTAVERIAIPTLPTPAPVVKKTPTPTPKATVKKPAPVAKKKPTVTCTKGAITRVFDGTKCPSGFKK